MKIFSFFRDNDDGASAVEFAIVLPLFLVFVFGIIEFSIIMYNKALITNASREGARFGILYTEPAKDENVLKSEIENRIKSKILVDSNDPTKYKLISLGGAAVPIVESTLIPDDPDDYIEVKVTYSYNFLLLPELEFMEGLSNPLPITSTTKMRMEYQGP